MKRQLPPDLEELATRITIAADEEQTGKLAAKAIVEDIANAMKKKENIVM